MAKRKHSPRRSADERRKQHAPLRKRAGKKPAASPARVAPLPPLPFTSSSLELIVTLPVSPERLWTALVDETSAWWPAEFYTAAPSDPRPRQFIIEPFLGGRMMERWGPAEARRENGLVWGVVIGCDAPRLLIIQGVLIPPFGPGAVNVLSFRIVPDPAGARLHVTDLAFGQNKAESRRGTLDGWANLLDGALRRYLRANERR